MGMSMSMVEPGKVVEATLTLWLRYGIVLAEGDVHHGVHAMLKHVVLNDWGNLSSGHVDRDQRMLHSPA
jgi:hypothetical protein